MERLDRLLAHRGHGTRKEIKALIRAGRVTVNGRPARDAGQAVDPVAMSIRVDGQEQARRRHLQLMLHKPAGVITATADPRAATVLDLVPAHLRWIGLHPVGRLDRETEGLLLLTTDGELSHRLTSPRWHVEKEYLALLDGPVGASDVAAFAAGLRVDAELTALPARLEPLLPAALPGGMLPAGEHPAARVTIAEGKFHQVRRMFAARGRTVMYLRRERMGPLHLDPELAPGGVRPLTAAEETALYGAAGLPVPRDGVG